MALEEDHCFTITWFVKNFSMCPIDVGEYIESPVICVSWFQDSEWSLKLYPKGIIGGKDYVGCYFACNSLGNYKGGVTMQYGLSIPPLEVASANTRTYLREECWGYHNKCITRENLFKEKDLYLPNDTLTFVASLQLLKSGELDREKEMIYNWVMESKIRSNICHLRECRVETVIEVHRKSVSWPIRKYGSLPVDKQITLTVGSAVKDLPSFYVTFSKGLEGKAKIEIRKKKDGETKKVFVKCNASVTYAPEGVTCQTEDTFLFKNAEIWNFPSFINFDDLEAVDYLDNTNDVLHLRFDFAFSIEGQMHSTEIPVWEPKDLSPEYPLPFKPFLDPSVEQSAIVNLKSGDRTFTVHRCLLQVESEVFQAMFENDMKEKETGEVNIASVDPVTLARMLTFLYSNNIEDDLSASGAMKLYSAAHLYQMISLVNRCSIVLQSSLVVSNVCEILSLADLHKDERLLEAAESFVAANSHRVLVSKDWKDLIESNACLAAKVMLKMLIC